MKYQGKIKEHRINELAELHQHSEDLEAEATRNKFLNFRSQCNSSGDNKEKDGTG